MSTRNEARGRQQVDAEQLRGWLVARAARYVRMDAADVDCDLALSQYGMDSVSAVAIAVDLEDTFGVVLDVDTLWKYPTVNQVVEMLLSLRPGVRDQREELR
ncbi:acyl carrier protein [Frankia sp. R82]|uniref:acyl carrier protein n=1 Tax=Frankia sp. R82 TaxID=2950553 RepID=UPI002042D379|nr:acyl carrier protein [Frankia sp. R82]MCM3886598.1 acyl carrier protein [Frankia sp. R82]